MNPARDLLLVQAGRRLIFAEFPEKSRTAHSPKRPHSQDRMYKCNSDGDQGDLLSCCEAGTDLQYRRSSVFSKVGYSSVDQDLDDGDHNHKLGYHHSRDTDDNEFNNNTNNRNYHSGHDSGA